MINVVAIILTITLPTILCLVLFWSQEACKALESKDKPKYLDQ